MNAGISLGDEIMARIASYCVLGIGAILLAAGLAAPLQAQNLAVDDLKSKIATAQIVQQASAKALAHCGELNGTNFYFQPRDRVLSLSDYHRSLDSLALQGAFNPDTHRPWSQQDANTRWAEVQRQATQDQANCALVASLPFLQKKLQEVQQQMASSPAAPAATNK
jgi:hypothetical protein